MKKYNFPLKGYTDKTARNKPITRGTVAQILSSSQVGPNDVKGAYNFLVKHHLTNSPSFEAYNATGGLKKSHISSSLNEWMQLV
ncbi:hypothetical protein MKY41_10425 [Sporosarcina sp. FSL W7-1349]|uniref:hypothetical protein n=1 Tax=Sporosarcina sp. FSL W7-1349 TaxID=2921561 RepID=UPI0030FCA6E5